MPDMAEDIKGDEADKTEVSDVLSVAKKRFKYCVDSSSASRISQRDDLKFLAGSPDNGWQWPESVKLNREKDKNGARPCLTINKLPQHVNQVVNEQRKNRPSIKVRPVDSGADVHTAKVYDGIIRHIESVSDANIAYTTACDAQVAHGEGYFRLLTEYTDEMSFNQEILIKRIKNSFSVYMDPDISDPSGSDARYCFITTLLDEGEYEAAYPDAEPVDWDEVGTGDDDNQWFTSDKKVRIAEYFVIEKSAASICQWSDGQVSLKDENFDLTLAAYAALGIGLENERETEIRTVRWYKLSGFEILEERDWIGKYIPVVRVVGNEWDVDGKKEISGLVRNSKDAQRMYNYWKSAETEMIALAPKAPFMAAVEAIAGFETQYDSANHVNYSYLPFNAKDSNGEALPMPQRSMPPMPQQAIVTAAMGAADDIKTTTGQYDASLGAKSNETSGRAILARQREGDIGTYHYLDNLAVSIRHAGRIIIDLIPKVYNERNVARILGEDGSTDHVRLNSSIGKASQPVQDPQSGEEIGRIYNLGAGTYDVEISVGPGYSTKRQESVDAMTQLLQGNPQLWGVIGDLFIKNQDWPGADEMSNRLKATLNPAVKMVLDGKDPIAAQLIPEIQRLQQQLQAAIQGQEAQELKIDQFKAQVDGYNAETKRMEALFKAFIPDPSMLQQSLNGIATSPDISQGQQPSQPQNQQPQPQRMM